MTKLQIRLLSCLVGLGVSIGIAGSAAAYCIDPNFALLWGELDDPEQIPVYVSIGPHTSVEHTGLTTAQVVRLTREMIARHNEAAVGPTLVYMGLTASDVDYGPDAEDEVNFVNDADAKPDINAKFESRPFGITVDSYSCEWRQKFAPCGGDLKTRGCARTAKTHPKARVTLVPVDCIDGAEPHMLDANDIATVMLHEFGHALGLGHSQIGKDACEQAPGHVHGNAVDGNAGVMHAQIGGNFPALREWRRDDIEGLAALYGPAPAAELVAWDDLMFPEPPSPEDFVTVASGGLRRPPSVTSATSSSGARVYIATTNVDDRVVVYTHATDDPLGAAPPEIVDPSEAGRTWGNPGIAQSDESLFVAWSANERADSSRVDLRWATRPLDGHSWTAAEIAVQPHSRVKRLAAGHVPVVDRFVIVSLSDYESRPRILLIEPDAQLWEIAELDAPPAFDIGDPACVAEGSRARCVIPFSTNELAGPKLGWLILAVDELGAWVVDVDAGEVDATGKLGFAGRPDLSRFRGSAGAQRYILEDLDDADASPTPPPELSGQSWPIAIASAWSDQDLRWWGYARRSVVCGDGVAQRSEECDDGNLESGDGCSASCTIEDEPQGDLDPEHAGETGTGGPALDDAGDCDCRSAPSAPPAAAVLSIMLLALGRSRRSSWL